jgi:uncharacterized coiled-coil protein SlyX
MENEIESRVAEQETKIKKLEKELEAVREHVSKLTAEVLKIARFVNPS